MQDNRGPRMQREVGNSALPKFVRVPKQMWRVSGRPSVVMDCSLYTVYTDGHVCTLYTDGHVCTLYTDGHVWTSLQVCTRPQIYTDMRDVGTQQTSSPTRKVFMVILLRFFL